MALHTAFTELASIEHPIALAPMAGSAGGALAAAVSNGGGLGLLGAGGGQPDWMETELGIVAELTARPWGVGFLSWAVDERAVRMALEHRPAAVMLSFGDPGPFAPLIQDAGAKLIIQVTDMDEAQRASEVGADVIVAQGAEAGGHGGKRSTLPFVPAVVDLVDPVPVLAAGGIADGRGLAAALVLGAQGALIGSRFQASSEALVSSPITQAILAGRGDDTERSRILDIARGTPWPESYTGRALRNAFGDRWRGREDELRSDDAARGEYKKAVRAGDMEAVPVWVGEAIDLITQLSSATDLVRDIATGAEEALARTRST